MTSPNVLKKICSIDELGDICAEARSTGKNVAQAHGTFDLLHLGHVRHLQAARRECDILMVTVTADSHVNKGPGRPVFNEHLRAEMLAALEYVDWVGVNPSPDAVSAINVIKPSIYIKGQDYQNPEGDVTGKIVSEREAVEAHGGRIVFTEEITFSSSELINRHMNVFEPHVRDHLDSLRNNGGLDEILELIEHLSDMRVLFVGDAIIDEYHYVQPMNKPPKENVIATRYQDHEAFAGGIFAAANHAASFCKDVGVISVLGDRSEHEELIRESLKPNVELIPVHRPDAPTTCKQRFVDPSYMRKLFEVYHIDDDPIDTGLSQQLNDEIAQRAKDYDLVVVADFGHGMIGPTTIEALEKHASFLAVNAQSNSANMGFNLINRYKRPDYVCIDHTEARLATRNRTSSISDIVSNELSELIETDKMIVTHGKFGCVTYEKGHPTHTIPAFTRNVVDTMGAGDAFLAISAPLVAAGGAMHQIGFIGNVVGAIKVSIVGHRSSVEKADLVKAVTALLK